MRRLLAETGHRPFPRPERRPWIMFMRWERLLFCHWRIDVGALRPHVPEGLAIDEFDGRAWIGVVPFVMSGVRARGLPALPGLRRFPELNVRTYVTPRAEPADGHPKPGVWFFSLDAAHALAVETARLTFGLPYLRARMSCVEGDDGTIAYRSERLDRRGPQPGSYEVAYRPTGPVAAPAQPGTIEHFLTERYCLYAQYRRRLVRGDIHHRPWPLQPATIGTRRNALLDAADFAGAIEGDPADPPLVHYAHTLDVVAWPPVRA